VLLFKLPTSNITPLNTFFKNYSFDVRFSGYLKRARTIFSLWEQEPKMDYIKIRFGNDFDQLTSRIEKTFEEMFRPRPASPMFATAECTWTPAMDIYETPEEIFIRAELGGVDKEDLEIEINSKAVRLYGKRSEIPRVANATYRLAEIQYGKFERILFLPAPIDTEVVSSSYANGFLELRLVKLPREKTYKIPIDSS
jgi:HSP20 family protein